jgi:hypothetical protein
MYSRTKDFGMPKHLCPWQIDAIDYDGCCSHPAIKERVEGEIEGFTAEKIEAKDSQKKQKKEYIKGFKAKSKAERRYACNTCDLAFEDQSLLNTHYLTKKHVDKVKGVPDKVVKKPEYKTSNANVAAKTHYCKICDYSASTSTKLNIHLTSQKHKKRAAAAAGSSL